jgi:tetratricopeptide (TPR) repeat protein
VRDPWQDDALEELVTYLRSARETRASAWALVVTSSEALSAEVLEALGEQLGELEVIDVSQGEGPRVVVEAMVARPSEAAARTSVVVGLSAVLDSEHRDELLAWLNFHREDFERPATAFVFMVQARHTDPWQRLAPDLDRYTQHFEFIHWGDLVADAERTASELDVEMFPLDEALHRAERRLEHSRQHDAQELKALIEVGNVALHSGAIGRAAEVIEAAVSRARTGETGDALVHAKGRSSDMARKAAIARASLVTCTGHPKEALRELEELEHSGGSEGVRNALAVSRFLAGLPRRALAELEASLGSDADNRLRLSQNAAVIGEWLGEVQRALAWARGPSPDLRPWQLSWQAGLWGALASLLVDTGELFEALDVVAKSQWLANGVGWDYARIAGLANLARATLDAGHPVAASRTIERPGAPTGWRTADGYGFAIVRAEIRWTLDGPKAVLPVVRDERERQRGWDAPIPAAELAYVRALASVGDDEERRYLQDASDRFRSMDGWHYLSELERRLARLDRLAGDLDRATDRVREGLEWHAREGARPREARDRTELAMIAVGRGDAEAALEFANQALDLIRACGTRLHEPAALVALAAAERALGNHEIADAHHNRWRRLVRGIGAKGLEAALERDAAWARDVTAR